MKTCPRCDIKQSGMDECEICGYIFEKNDDPQSLLRKKDTTGFMRILKNNKKYIIFGSLIIVAILIVSVIITGIKNTNIPEYVKNISIYKEGDGIVFYFVLADNNGQPTAYGGWVLYELTCGLKRADEVPVLWGIKRVEKSDFHKTTIGLGGFKRDTILYSFGRFSNYTLESKIKNHREKTIKEIRKNSYEPAQRVAEYRYKIEKILSTDHKNGRAKIIFIMGEPPSDVMTHLNSDCSEDHMRFLEAQINVFGMAARDIRKSEKTKSLLWDHVSAEEKVSF